LAVVLIAYRGGLASLPGRVLALADRLRPRVEPVLRRLVAHLPEEWRRRPRRSPAVQTPFATRLRSRVAARWSAVRRSVRAFRERLPIAQLRPSPDLAPAAPLDFEQALEPEAPSANGSESHSHLSALDAGSHEVAAARRVELAAFRPTGAREDRTPLVEAEHVTVRFGGLTAVNDASLTVREGEIVGLIGPNGAGKTTFFNAIAGYNTPAEGTIRLYGADVTDLPVYRRARVGVARTFQLIQLFRELTVYDNLLVATHVHNPTGFGSHVLVTGPALDAETAAVQRVNSVLRLLDLADIADCPTGDLPFGVLRMVEVARALVTGFRVIMLDEPASGLDNAETDRLIDVLRFVRGLGVSMLLIEHDVRMVTGVSDYMYVLEQGRLIAEGLPEDVQRNPGVIAAYLGEPTGAEQEVEPMPVG